MHGQFFTQAAEEHNFLVRRFFERNADELAHTADRLVRTLQSGGKILLFGNGGSAADAQHIAAELVGRFQHERPALPALALTTDTSVLTSVANDYGYECVFTRQIEALGQRGDAAIAISTSGSSLNVVEAVRAARAKGMSTVGLLGRDGGILKELVDHPLVVEAQKTSRIQEVHALVGHVLCEVIERELFFRRDG
ncbi:MAG: D-sedoheptulose 7-phosphate isomerase [Acidobacteria bacterium]|nr:D-sedoheptulose 7-phosphate isomerase [Acidobacteriota bacterium]